MNASHSENKPARTMNTNANPSPSEPSPKPSADAPPNCAVGVCVAKAIAAGSAVWLVWMRDPIDGCQTLLQPVYASREACLKRVNRLNTRETDSFSYGYQRVPIVGKPNIRRSANAAPIMKTSNQLSEEPRTPDRVGCDGSGSAFDRTQWEEAPECRRCFTPMSLNAGCEWPDDDRALLCGSCLTRTLEATLAQLDGTTPDRARCAVSTGSALSCAGCKYDDFARKLETELAHWKAVARYNQATSIPSDARMRHLLAEVVRCVPTIAPEWRQTYLYEQCAAASQNVADEQRRGKDSNHE